MLTHIMQNSYEYRLIFTDGTDQSYPRSCWAISLKDGVIQFRYKPMEYHITFEMIPTVEKIVAEGLILKNGVYEPFHNCIFVRGFIVSLNKFQIGVIRRME